MTRNHREPNYGAALRIVELIRRLSARRPPEAPIDEMAQVLNVHPRTLRRYASALSAEADAGGAPVVLRIERRAAGPVIVLSDPQGYVIPEPVISEPPRASSATPGPPASLREMVVRFAPSITRDEAARRWGGTTVWAAGDDGTHTLRVRVVIDEALVRWLLSFGGDAEVLAPVTLREDVAARHRRGASRYD